MSSISRIIVPTDFSPHAERALKFAIQLAADTGAQVHVISVDDDPILNAPTTSDEYRQQAGRKIQAKIDEMIAGQGTDSGNIHSTVLHGGAIRQIMAYVEENQVDLIVLGTIGRGAVANLLLGSVAAAIIKKASCPVVSVR